MSLGVLNNLNAMYAENNLNNTSNSLGTVLQQLSSGSKINSGADDAAGLSLVNGLQANSTALAQSKTNAQEGVGLLQVADGALSQVTSLLNRAVTLATEASNGTLNSSQDAAANQEYKSILSEINNIGATTTYNQQAVFGGGTVGIYSGDSSNKGSSIDNLSISALSSSNVGDTNGAMSYNTGQNVFIDLSAGGTGNAQQTDSITAASTLTISYLNSDGSAGSVTTAAASTVDGLIAAINGSGRGLTASFTTGAAAGDAGAGTDTGIMISGDINSTLAPTVGGLQKVAIASGANDTSVGGTSTLADDNSGGVATISYSASAGTNLSGTDLTNAGQCADRADRSECGHCQRGGAGRLRWGADQHAELGQSVLSTQQENVTAAQNAVQATDYASATSNMSKYEILSQTGISALAQANSLQQEVTKLLQ